MRPIHFYSLPLPAGLLLCLSVAPNPLSFLTPYICSSGSEGILRLKALGGLNSSFLAPRYKHSCDEAKMERAGQARLSSTSSGCGRPEQS